MNATMLHDMFYLGVPVAEKIIRPIVVYFFLIAVLRLAGKRELAQLNPFDLIVLLTLSNTVQNAIIGEDNSLTGGLIGAGTLLLINHSVVRYLYGHERVDRLVEGAPDVLIDRAVLDPGGTICFIAKKPTAETYRHQEIITRLDQISARLAALRP